MTQQYLQFLKVLQQGFKNEWANGTYTSGDTYGTLQLNSEAIGKVRLLEDLLEVEYEMIVEEMAHA